MQSLTALTPALGQLDFAINQLKLINPAEDFFFGFHVESIFCHELSWLKGVSDTRSGAKLITVVREGEELAEEEKEHLYFGGNEMSEWLILCH